MSPRKGESPEQFKQRRSIYSRDYHVKNRDSIRARSKAWALANPERQKELRRNHYLANRERQLGLNSEWRKAHPMEMLAYVQKWQRSNPEKTKAIYRNWVKNNPDTRRVTKKQSNHKRNARFRSIPFEDCSEKIALLNKERFCRWCCTRLSDAIKTIDHIIPLARGGHHISDNLAAACRKCNFSRGDKLVSEWLPNQEFNN